MQCNHASPVNNLKHLVPRSHTFQFSSPRLLRDEVSKLRRRLSQAGAMKHKTRTYLQMDNCIRFGHRQLIRNLQLCEAGHKWTRPDLTLDHPQRQRIVSCKSYTQASTTRFTRSTNDPRIFNTADCRFVDFFYFFIRVVRSFARPSSTAQE